MEAGNTLETPNSQRPLHPDCLPVNKDGESVEGLDTLRWRLARVVRMHRP
jgi:hypothetical protein